ncbi:MAG: phosphoribosylamine--glycine ligase [Alphaproteobacteria bacterium]|nr:phosphoribosylamine--glycine ligase [Alphaproteobacteria bacterium]
MTAKRTLPGRVLLVGGGGREHALARAMVTSPLCEALYCAPGNAGIAEVAHCVPIGAEDVDGIVRFAKEENIAFVVVGPEGPLVLGLVDALEAAGVPAFGPDRKAARLEGSKGFMKDICAKYGVPTAAYARFQDVEAAKAYLRTQGAPIVIKADGLAAGKGVTVARTLAEAEAAIEEALVGDRFGAAGRDIVIEELLEGEEASFFALVDGEAVVPMIAAQDHKAVGDGDTGPNTGGMGAYSPASVVTAALASEIMERIFLPTARGMVAEGCSFRGVLFAGLMIGKGGVKLLEFNIRFGDPECQVLMARLESDLLAALVAAQEGRLDEVAFRWRKEAALCVVMAAKGYPGAYEKGTPIQGIAEAETLPDVVVYHAGTKAEENRLLAAGGRVLGVTALGETIEAAQRLAYEAVDRIDWPDGFCRRDIGWRAVGR